MTVEATNVTPAEVFEGVDALPVDDPELLPLFELVDEDFDPELVAVDEPVDEPDDEEDEEELGAGRPVRVIAVHWAAELVDASPWV